MVQLASAVRPDEHRDDLSAGLVAGVRAAGHGDVGEYPGVASPCPRAGS